MRLIAAAAAGLEMRGVQMEPFDDIGWNGTPEPEPQLPKPVIERKPHVGKKQIAKALKRAAQQEQENHR